MLRNAYIHPGRTKVKKKRVKKYESTETSDLSEPPGKPDSRTTTSKLQAGPEQHQEIELKLTGDRKALSSIFGDLHKRKPKTARVVSTYYDTPDALLRRRGFSLRLRPKGDQYELTLKSRDANTLTRGEWNSLLPEPMVDLSQLPADAPWSRIGTILAEELLPRFTTDMERSKAVLNLKETKFEIAFDNGRIYNDSDETVLTELEFELLDGSVSAMLEHVRSKLGDRAFVLGTLSKADRGEALADDRPPDPVKAAKPALKAADTLESAVRKIIDVTLSQIMGNLAAAQAGSDPEGVHQLRVSLRRLRSALTLFKTHLSEEATAFNAEAKRALDMLGGARDLDVFLLETLPPVVDGTGGGSGLERLGKIAAQKRQSAYEDVRKLIRDPQFNRFLLDLIATAHRGDLVTKGAKLPLQPIAAKLLQKRHKKVLKLGRGFEDLPAPERHEVRLALKKLRYACDYFQNLFPPNAVKPYLKRLSAMQEDLGHLNDLDVAEDLVDRLTANDAKAAIGAAVLKGWYRHRLLSIEPYMVRDWRQFSQARPYWQS